MTIQTLLALAGFAFVSSVTPGPNNLMLMTSGANFGLRRTLPHLLGVSLGHGFLILCVGSGLATLFERAPQVQHGLKAAAMAYMLWLAWKIARAAPPKHQHHSAAKPLTFLQAAAFQWVNPKGWAMALTAISAYAEAGWRGALTVSAVFIIVNAPSVTLWAVLGTQIARVLRDPRRLRVFNLMMAALLLATLAIIL